MSGSGGDGGRGPKNAPSGARNLPAGVTITCRSILPLQGPPLERGWLRIGRGRIEGIGRRRPSGLVIDLGDAIILPGLVNAHTHLEFSDLTAPLPAGSNLTDWIEELVRLRRARLPGAAEETRLATALSAGLQESAAAGVTALGEIATAVPAQGYPPHGPRVRLYREGLGWKPTATFQGLVARDLNHLRHALGGLSPHAPYSVSAGLGGWLVRTAVAGHLPVAMHLAESRAEAEFVATGGGPFQDLLAGLGVWPVSPAPRLHSAADWISQLARAPRGSVVHGTFLDETALSRLIRHRDRLCLVVCPRTTLRLAGALPALVQWRQAGIRLAVGTDSRASNPDLSILAECRTLVEAGMMSPAEALRTATRGGAWALLLEHRCGQLAVGRPADFIVLQAPPGHADPHVAALDPATRVVATVRGGRLIFGELASRGSTAGSWQSASQ